MTKTAAEIIAKASAIRRSPQFLAKLRDIRAKAHAEKPAPRTLPKATSPAPAKAPIELDNGDRLIAARTLWSATMTEAHRLSRTASRNLNSGELRLLEVARALPRTSPNEGSTLREWRHFAAKVEAARPDIEAARTRI
jgi:hypothetical protein